MKIIAYTTTLQYLDFAGVFTQKQVKSCIYLHSISVPNLVFSLLWWDASKPSYACNSDLLSSSHPHLPPLFSHIITAYLLDIFQIFISFVQKHPPRIFFMSYNQRRPHLLPMPQVNPFLERTEHLLKQSFKTIKSSRNESFSSRELPYSTRNN